MQGYMKMKQYQKKSTLTRSRTVKTPVGCKKWQSVLKLEDDILVHATNAIALTTM